MASSTLHPAAGAIVMAAGAGRRMGRVPKALFERDGEALLLRQLRLLAGAGVRHIAVVLGHHAERIAEVLAAARKQGAPGLQWTRWVTNPAPDRGPGSSLRCGLAALPDDLDPFIVVLGDQPLLAAEDIGDALATWRARPPGIALIQPQHGERLGHPVTFDRGVREAVAQQPDAEGLREWRRAHRDRVCLRKLDHVRCTTDVDTPEDVRRLRAEHGIALAGPPEMHAT